MLDFGNPAPASLALGPLIIITLNEFTRFSLVYQGPQDQVTLASRAISPNFLKKKRSLFWRSALGACLSQLLRLHSRGPPDGLVQEYCLSPCLQQPARSRSMGSPSLGLQMPISILYIRSEYACYKRGDFYLWAFSASVSSISMASLHAAKKVM